jgi:hypothetical protein
MLGYAWIESSYHPWVLCWEWYLGPWWCVILLVFLKSQHIHQNRRHYTDLLDNMFFDSLCDGKTNIDIRTFLGSRNVDGIPRSPSLNYALDTKYSGWNHVLQHMRGLTHYDWKWSIRDLLSHLRNQWHKYSIVMELKNKRFCLEIHVLLKFFLFEKKTNPNPFVVNLIPIYTLRFSFFNPRLNVNVERW